MVHSDFHEHQDDDLDPKLRAKVLIIGVLLALGLWGVAGFAVASLL
jgi:hypothetical protein